MTLRQVGGAIGIAPLSSLLAGAFRDRLDVTGLPAPVAHTAGESVVAAHLIADRTHSAHLAASADAAYVHGMGLVLLVCGARPCSPPSWRPLSCPERRTTVPAGPPREPDPAVAAARDDARQ